jgi:hypothetical protein
MVLQPRGQNSSSYIDIYSICLLVHVITANRLLCLPPAFTLVSCLAYSSTQKMEVTRSSETSVNFQQTTLHYVPEDGTLLNLMAVHKLVAVAMFNFVQNHHQTIL